MAGGGRGRVRRAEARTLQPDWSRIFLMVSPPWPMIRPTSDAGMPCLSSLFPPPPPPPPPPLGVPDAPGAFGLVAISLTIASAVCTCCSVPVSVSGWLSVPAIGSLPTLTRAPESSRTFCTVVPPGPIIRLMMSLVTVYVCVVSPEAVRQAHG